MGWLAAAAAAMALPGGGRPYQTSCEIVDSTTVSGIVTNPGPDFVRIDGLVRFIFTVADSMSRPTVQVQSALMVPPGRTVNVAVARIGSSLNPSELCRLDVSGAIQ